MKGIVTKLLNQRIKDASVNAEKSKPLEVGKEIEIVDILTGDSIDGNNVWYQLNTGIFVWSGGVTGNREIGESKVFSIDHVDIYKDYPGEALGIGIAILDSGINQNHPFLKKRIKHYREFEPTTTPIHPHGHKVAGIIASDDFSANRPSADLFVFKTMIGNATIDEFVLRALDEIIDNSIDFKAIDVINMSLSIGDADFYFPKIQERINTLLQKGIVTVIAGGKNGKANNLAAIQNAIKVGVYDKVSERKFNKHYSLAFMDIPIRSYSTIGDEMDTTINNESAYAAYTSAIVAKYISENGIEKKPTRLEKISEYIDSISSSNIEPFKPYKT